MVLRTLSAGFDTANGRSAMTSTTRGRMVDAAMALFAERGFDSTSVEDVVARAGVGRTTFFRHFPTKEDVVFPDHDGLLRRVDARLATATAATGRTALEEATGIVLEHYLAEGETARQRYRLTRTVTPLRHRELASVHRYVRLFSGHLRSWLGDAPDAALQAELTAAQAALRRALDRARTRIGGEPAPTPVTVVVTPGGDVDAIADEVRRAL